MKNITCLKEDDYKNFCNKIENKRKKAKDFLVNLDSYVQKRYQDYDNFKEDLFNIPNSKIKDILVKKSFKKLYKSRLFNSTKEEICELIYYCPYCLIDPAREVDHYLPQDDFAEFSILKTNLIPICGSCNKKKLSRRKDENSRLFLNAYFDSIPLQQFLFVSFKILENDNIETNFYIDKNKLVIEEKLWNIIYKHFNLLDLKRRYSWEINEIISWIKTTLEDIWADIKLDFLKKILVLETKKHERYGNNYWKYVVYKEVIENEDLCRFLCGINLQKHE